MKYSTLQLIGQLLLEEKERARTENRVAIQKEINGEHPVLGVSVERLNRAEDAYNDFMTTDFR